MHDVGPAKEWLAVQRLVERHQKRCGLRVFTHSIAQRRSGLPSLSNTGMMASHALANCNVDNSPRASMPAKALAKPGRKMPSCCVAIYLAATIRQRSCYYVFQFYAICNAVKMYLLSNDISCSDCTLYVVKQVTGLLLLDCEALQSRQTGTCNERLLPVLVGQSLTDGRHAHTRLLARRSVGSDVLSNESVCARTVNSLWLGHCSRYYTSGPFEIKQHVLCIHTKMAMSIPRSYACT